MNINFRLVISLLGYIIASIGVLMFIPAFIDLFTHYSKGLGFFIIGFLVLFLGIILILSADKKSDDPNRISSKDSLLLTFSAWVSIATVAALPFTFSYLNMSYTNSFFETMSAVTTTGASIVNDLTELSYGFHFWRVFLGWIGGIGIIVTGTILIPYMQGSMSILKLEAFDTFDSAFSQAKKIALGVTLIYIVITIIIILALVFIAQIGVFDSLLHAMSAVSTLGFSNKDLSIYEYHNFKMEIIIILGMITGGIPYILMYYFLFLRKSKIFKDKQLMVFFKIIAIVTILVTYWIVVKIGYPLGEAIRLTLFATINVITGTGFTTFDYNMWGTFPLILFFALTMLGSCSGSKSGGIKIFRLQIAYTYLKINLEKIFLNRHINVPFYNGKEIAPDVALNVFAYWFIFLMSILVIATIITFFEVDLLTAFAASIACISNMGLALGGEVGPLGNYAGLPSIVKWILSFGMILGRLEFFVVLALFNRKFWIS